MAGPFLCSLRRSRSLGFDDPVRSRAHRGYLVWLAHAVAIRRLARRFAINSCWVSRLEQRHAPGSQRSCAVSGGRLQECRALVPVLDSWYCNSPIDTVGVSNRNMVYGQLR